jgi:sarcosine oxidase delta subunit
MAVYEFACPTCGQISEETHRMKDAPEIGSPSSRACIKGCSTRPVRIASSSVQTLDAGWKPYISRALPRHVPGCREFDATGRPIVSSRAVERNIIAASKGTLNPLERD